MKLSKLLEEPKLAHVEHSRSMANYTNRDSDKTVVDVLLLVHVPSRKTRLLAEIDKIQLQQRRWPREGSSVYHVDHGQRQG